MLLFLPSLNIVVQFSHTVGRSCLLDKVGSELLCRTLKSIWMEHPDCRGWPEGHNFFCLSAELVFPKKARQIFSDKVFWLFFLCNRTSQFNMELLCRSTEF